ncbi:MAG: hypothetical protein R6U26_03410 [Candidatus Undinarchaeales archaeon]
MEKKMFVSIFALAALLALSAGVSAVLTPQISLKSPGNDAYIYSNISNFTFSVGRTSEVEWCRLHFNDSILKIKNDIEANETNRIESTVQNGTWEWHVECMNNQTNTGVSSNQTVYVQIDRKEPTIYAHQINSTANGTGYSRLRFKAIDTASDIDFCELIIDGEVNATKGTIYNNSEMSFSLNLPRGDHTWKVNCTDEMENEGESSTALIEVDYIPSVKTSVPENNTRVFNKNVNFTYTPVSYNNFADCALMLNKSPDADENVERGKPYFVFNESESDIENNSKNYFLNVPLTNGTWLWKINCSDNEGNRGASKMRNLSVWLQLPASSITKVTLNSPSDRETNTDGIVTFNYTPDEIAEIESCVLLTNGSIRMKDKSVGSGRMNSFEKVEISNGKWAWAVSCNDVYGGSYTTDERILFVEREAAEASSSQTEEQELANESLAPSAGEQSYALAAVSFLSIIIIFLVLLIHEDTRYHIIGKYFTQEEPEFTELEKYINEHLDKGFSETEIEEQLKEFNWDSDKISLAFSRVREKREEA